VEGALFRDRSLPTHSGSVPHSGINHAKNLVADDSSIPLAMRAMTCVLVDYFQKHAVQ